MPETTINRKLFKPCPCGGRAELRGISEHGCFSCSTMTYAWYCKACGTVEQKGCPHVEATNVKAFVHLACPWCNETVLVKAIKALPVPDQDTVRFFCKPCSNGAVMAVGDDEAFSAAAERMMASIRENPTFALNMDASPAPPKPETWRDRPAML